MNDANMEKRILFISNKKTSFLSISIKSRLQQENFDVMISGFDIGELSKIEERPNLVLMNFEANEEIDEQFLVYVRDLFVEEEKRVYLCGYEHEIKDIASILPKSVVKGTFIRPFELSELIKKMNKEMDMYKQEQGKKHILVVDDSGEMLHAIRAWLSDTYRVSIVNSGANAILFLANQKPDLILLDYEMPFCSGPQMMEMIRAESSTSSIPIIFLTGKSDKESVKKVLSLKPQGYMLKTTTQDKIKETIANFFINQKAKEYNKELEQ